MVAIYKRKLKFVLTNVIFLVFDFIRAIMTKGIVNSVNSAQTEQGEKLTVPYGVAIFIGLCAAGVIVWLR